MQRSYSSCCWCFLTEILFNYQEKRHFNSIKHYMIELFLTGSRTEQWLENTAYRKLDTCVALSACDSSFQIFSVLTF